MTILLGNNRRLNLGPVFPLTMTEADRVVLADSAGTTVTVAGPAAEKLAKILREMTPEEIWEAPPRTPRGAELVMGDAERRQQANRQADAEPLR